MLSLLICRLVLHLRGYQKVFATASARGTRSQALTSFALNERIIRHGGPAYCQLLRRARRGGGEHFELWARPCAQAAPGSWEPEWQLSMN